MEYIFALMPDEMTVAEASAALGTSTQTIRNLLSDGTLRGRRGPRNWWLVGSASVAEFLKERGRLDGGRRRRSTSAVLEVEVERLRSEVDRLARIGVSTDDDDAVRRERDALRARVVSLEDGLARMREAAELQRRADRERDELVKHLLAGLAAAERADVLRRGAVEELEAALASGTVPGHIDAEG